MVRKHYEGPKNLRLTVSKINLSKIGWEGGESTLIWIMSLNILLLFFEITPKTVTVSHTNESVIQCIPIW